MSTRQKTQLVSQNRRPDAMNAKFFLKGILESLSRAIQSVGSPVTEISDTARAYLSADQYATLESSFSRRRAGIESLASRLNAELDRAPDIGSLRALESTLQQVRERYLLIEQVFDYYVDILDTRSEHDMGSLLKGCDLIARASIEPALKILGKQTPSVVCYLDRGQGASILKAGIYLWDGEQNPAAIVKVTRSSIPHPRLTAILHECGHQVAQIVGWNKELSELLFSVIIKEGGSSQLAQMWASWASEIAADFWSLHQANFATTIGLAEVVAGSPERVFQVIPGDPHPMPYLRVLMGLTSCSAAFGHGPWDEFASLWKMLYPIELATSESALVARQSLPLLPKICTAISKTRMSAFSGKTLENTLPWAAASPARTRDMLLKDLSDFSVDWKQLAKAPTLALSCFRIIQLFGGRSQEWIAQRMSKWLTSMALGGF